MYCTSYIQCTCMYTLYGHYARASTTHAHLDTFQFLFQIFWFRVGLLLVGNVNTQLDTSRKAPRPPQQKKDKLRGRREGKMRGRDS